MNAIPEEWIKKYVDTLTDTAASLPVGPFRDAVAMRAEHAMDLVKAWRESAAVQPSAARKTVWKPYDVFGVTGRLVYEDTGEDVPDQPEDAA